MKALRRITIGTFVALLLVAAGAFAQGLTGSLAGVVTQDTTPLPGVAITISSPQMQGTRTTVSNEAGGYSFGGIPPGDYKVKFELSGLRTVSQNVHVGVAQNARADASMKVEAVSEAITVTAAAPAVAETQEVQTNFSQKIINTLPVNRTIVAVTSLAPGVSSNGVNGLSISGGFSYDNLYMVNGAVIQENLRGQPHNLFIEDAIQETTIQTGAISAEFGNFTGGVVNAITKSGGNEYSGSLRDSLTNPAWTALSQNAFKTVNGAPAPVIPSPRLDVLTNQYEGTLGGRIIRDRLWFFTAGRRRVSTVQSNFSNGGAAYNVATTDKRFEGKGTAALTSSHSVVFSYVDAPIVSSNNCQIGCYDVTAIDPAVSNPNHFKTAFYNGILTSNLLLEGKWTKKFFAFVGYGGDDHDRIGGTPIRLTAPGFSTSVNEPFFCGNCGDELRNSDSKGAKASYFLGTRALGSHNFVAGGEQWHETRLSNNYQSPSGFVFRARTSAPTLGPDGLALVTIRGGNATTGTIRDFLEFREITQLSQGSNLRTDSAYVNDRWDLNSRFQLNLGARYDRNDSSDSAGHKVANDSKISPRLGIAFDPMANGRLRLHGGYAVYVGRLADTVAGLGSAAGNNSIFQYAYDGPDIISKPSEEALKEVFAWFDGLGGFKNGRLVGQSIPGASLVIKGSLTSPNVREYTFGASTTLNRGFVRADYIQRSWRDFYDQAQNMDTGRIQLPNGPADLGLVINSNFPHRDYKAVELQTQYKVKEHLNLGLNYTWSRLMSNIAGESSGGGPGTFGSTPIYYPEYYNWPGGENTPVGLGDGEDQTHKARAFAAYDLPTRFGNFNFSALERFESGVAYGLAGTIDVSFSNNFYGTGLPGGVKNPGYVTPPSGETYWFENPGSHRFPGFSATDLALNYETRPTWTHGASLFIETEVINAFNRHAALFLNRSIVTAAQDSTLKRFNPAIGDKPVEGVNWKKGPLFGLPTSVASSSTNGSFQQPRTARVSFGARF